MSKMSNLQMAGNSLSGDSSPQNSSFSDSPCFSPACTLRGVCLNLFDLKDENTNKRVASNKWESIKLVSADLNHELICNQMGQKVPPSQ